MNENSRIAAVFTLTAQDVGRRIYLIGEERAQIQGTLRSINPHPSWPATFVLEVEGRIAGNPWFVLLEVPEGLNVVIYED